MTYGGYFLYHFMYIRLATMGTTEVIQNRAYSWHSVQQGDLAAFERMYHELFPFVVNIAYRYLGDQHAAEDLAQDLFLKLWKDRKSISIDRSIKAYLATAIRNRSLNAMRANARRWDELNETDEVVASLDDPQLQVEAQDVAQAIGLALEKLPPRCRTVFLLKREEGLSLKEIAQKLDISPKTVENQMTKALKTLAINLRPLYPLVVLGILYITGLWGISLSILSL